MSTKPLPLINPEDLLSPSFSEAPLVRLLNTDFSSLTREEKLAHVSKLREARASSGTRKAKVERKKKKPTIDVRDYF